MSVNLKQIKSLSSHVLKENVLCKHNFQNIVSNIAVSDFYTYTFSSYKRFNILVCSVEFFL